MFISFASLSSSFVYYIINELNLIALNLAIYL